MITDPDYINQKLLLLIHKTQQDQKDQVDQSLSVEGKMIAISDSLKNENDMTDPMTSPSKPRLGRFDSEDSDTGTSSVTFQVC